jgi:hypothetical protein
MTPWGIEPATSQLNQPRHNVPRAATKKTEYSGIKTRKLAIKFKLYDSTDVNYSFLSQLVCQVV